jgi:hypothetical protein
MPETDATKVRAPYEYPGYRGPKPIEYQIQVLAETFGLDPSGALSFVKPPCDRSDSARALFPALAKFDTAKATEFAISPIERIPAGAEGWFAILRPQALITEELKSSWFPYKGTVERVLDSIKEARKGALCDCFNGVVNSHRRHQKTEEAYKKLCIQQNDSDILVVACQFGKHHAGRSVYQAREVMPESEFGLDSLAVASMLLTHPERFQPDNKSWIDCAGAEYFEEEWDWAPYFCLAGDDVKFHARPVNDADANYGSASGFLPQ